VSLLAPTLADARRAHWPIAAAPGRLIFRGCFDYKKTFQTRSTKRKEWSKAIVATAIWGTFSLMVIEPTKYAVISAVFVFGAALTAAKWPD
jgi:hypothetical protein